MLVEWSPESALLNIYALWYRAMDHDIGSFFCSLTLWQFTNLQVSSPMNCEYYFCAMAA